MSIILLPVAILTVAFVDLQLVKIADFPTRCRATFFIAGVFILPAYIFIARETRTGYNDALWPLLQVVVIGLGIIVSQLSFIQSRLHAFSHWRHQRLLSLIFIVLCIPFLWHVIRDHRIIESSSTHTNLQPQMPQLLCYHVMFLVFVAAVSFSGKRAIALD